MGALKSPPNNAWSLGLTQVHTPIGIFIDSSISARLAVVPNRQKHTHRPRYTSSNSIFALYARDAPQ